MERAAQTLLGQHDFAAFQASGGTAKTTVRTMRSVSLTRAEDEITFILEGDAFLRAYETSDRLALGVTAPPHGLELTKVHYPEAAFIRPEDIRWHEE